MNNKRINVLIFTSFILISILSCSILLKSHILVGADDMRFHLERVAELRESLLNFNVNPHYSFNYSHGSAVMSFYPYGNIFLLAILQILIGSIVKVIYVYYGLEIFISMLISYLSCLSYSNNRNKSYIFSIVYSLSTPLFFYQFGNMDLGVVTSYIALPLIFFGSLQLLKQKSHGLMIYIGFLLIIMSHVLSFFIALLLVFLLCLFNFESLTMKVIVKFIKNIFFAILSTSFVWLYPIYLLLSNRFKIASPGRFFLTGQSFSSLLRVAFFNEIKPYLSIISVITIILCFFFITKLKKEDKKLLYISATVILVCSNLFPWVITNFSILRDIGIFQFTWRLYVIPNLLLSYLLVEIFTIITMKTNYRIIISILIILFSVSLQMMNQHMLLNTAKDKHEFNYSYVSNKSLRTQVVNSDKKIVLSGKNGKSLYNLSNNKDYNRLLNTFTNSIVMDYYPKDQQKIFVKNFIDANDNNIFGQNNGEYKLRRVGYNSFDFNISKESNYINLPFVMYKGEKLNVTLNGKPTSYYNRNGKLELRGNFKGKYNLKLSERNMISFTVAYCLSLLFLICYLCRQFILKNKII